MSLHAMAHLHGLIDQGVRFHGLSLHGLRLPGLRIGPHGLRFKPEQLLEGVAIVGLPLLPLAMWIIKLRTDRWEESQRREDARVCAIDVAVTLAKSIQLCESVRSAIHTAGPVPQDTVEAAIESLDFSRQKLRGYLRRHIPLHELVPLATAAEQGLGEGCEAMLSLNGSSRSADAPDFSYARQLQTVRAELQAVADRLRRLQPDLGRAIAKVDAGWALPD